VIFAKPSKSVPVSPAIAHIKVFVNFENTKYVVKGYTVEGKKQLYGIDFPFNEKWIDGVVQVRHDKIIKAKMRRRRAMTKLGWGLG